MSLDTLNPNLFQLPNVKAQLTNLKKLYALCGEFRFPIRFDLGFAGLHFAVAFVGGDDGR